MTARDFRIAALLLAGTMCPWCSALAQPDLEGIWGIDPSLFRQYADAQYTGEGQRRVDAYNPTTDDPSYWCIPSGLGRAWDEPDTNVEIDQLEDRVVIRYEMFDLVRTVMLDQRGHPLEFEPSTVNIDGEPMPTMGHSIGWYEDDMLVIETVGYAPGYITTLLRISPSRKPCAVSSEFPGTNRTGWWWISATWTRSPWPLRLNPVTATLDRISA